jgi:hypothetical protein
VSQLVKSSLNEAALGFRAALNAKVKSVICDTSHSPIGILIPPSKYKSMAAIIASLVDTKKVGREPTGRAVGFCVAGFGVGRRVGLFVEVTGAFVGRMNTGKV